MKEFHVHGCASSLTRFRARLASTYAFVEREILPIISEAKDKELCEIVVHSGIVSCGGIQLPSITRQIFQSPIYRITKKVMRHANVISSMVKNNTLDINGLR